MITGLDISFDKIKQKQYYDADGIPIPESDIVNHPHIGHSVDRDNFLRLNFGQEHVNKMYAKSNWAYKDFLHIQGYPLYERWLMKGCCNDHSNC